MWTEKQQEALNSMARILAGGSCSQQEAIAALGGIMRPLTHVTDEESSKAVRKATFAFDHARKDLTDFLEGYITCSLWASTDDSEPSGGLPMDANYGKAYMDEDLLATMRNDCIKFIESNREDLDEWPRGYEHAGHDFWLSRNGHGSGFWDRYMVSAGESEELEALGNKLQEAAEEFGEFGLYIGDDEKVYGG